MQNVQYIVRKEDNVLDVCRKFNIGINQLVNNNCAFYPNLLKNPFMIYEGWRLSLPLVGNGGDTQYKMGDE